MSLLEDPLNYGALSRGDTLAEQIHRRLTSAISAGLYAPLERINLRRLAIEIGASVTPVREAVLRLVADGVLSVTEKNAIIVPERGMREVSEIFEMRRWLEGEMAFAAASVISNADVSLLRNTQKLFLAALDAGDYQRVLQLNAKFHFAIYERAESPLRLEFTKTLWLRIGPTLRYMYPLLHRGRADHRRHEDIIDAAAAKLPDDLRKAVLADLGSSLDALRQYVDGTTIGRARRNQQRDVVEST